MKTLPRWWREHFLVAEIGLAILVALGFMLWVENFHGSVVVEVMLRQNRGAIYGTMATIFGSLLGFVITTVSVILSFSASDRLAIVRESKHYTMLWKVFVSAIKVLGLTTLAALVGLLLDRDTTPNRLVFHAFVFLALLAALRLARCVWVLENVIAIVAAPPKGKSGGQA